MKRILCITLLCVFLLNSVAFAHPFSDVKGHWAENEIEKGYNNKSINGDPDGRFRPDDNITRAEFMKMITADVCEKTNSTIPADFDTDEHWVAKYVRFGQAYLWYAMSSEKIEGVLPGAAEELSDFDLPIQRWEMAYITCNVLYNVTGALPENDAILTTSDATEIQKNAHTVILTAATYCDALGLMKGDENNMFNPFDYGTRAEAVTIVNRVNDSIQKILDDYEENQDKIVEEYNKSIEETLVTYDEIPSGHPIATIVFSNNKKVHIKLYPEYAPQTVANFVTLAKEGFYDGLTFHRLVKDFVIQGGDPNGDGTGGSGKCIKGEFAANGFEQNTLEHKKGVVSMARSQNFDSASSQFFICLEEASFLDGNYAAFGEVVTGGMSVLNEFAKGEILLNEETGEVSTPKNPIVIKSITIK